MRRTREPTGGHLLVSARLLVAAVVLAVLSPTFTWAQTLPIYGSEGPASLQGTFNYTANSDTSGTLTVWLRNTSTTGQGHDGGYLTALVLNTPGSVAGASLSADPSTVLDVLMYNRDGVAASPYGFFDLGASGDGTFNGGGQPSDGGLAAGQEVTLTFTLTGTGMESLTTSSFLSLTSSADPDTGHGGAGNQLEVVAARFRGGTDSYKVLPTVVPEPGSLALLLPGLAPLGLVVRRRRR